VFFQLAETLRLPLYRLLDEMPYDEFTGWIEYYKRRPAGWQEDYRTFLLLKAQGLKQKPEELFPSLAPIFKKRDEDKKLGKISGANFKASALFKKLLGAKGNINPLLGDSNADSKSQGN
jgi:hypothetical protein